MENPQDTETTTATATTTGKPAHANRHVASFLKLPTFDEIGEAAKNPVQVLSDGRQLTTQRLFNSNDDLTLKQPILVQDTPTSIGMKVLDVKRRVTVRDVADILGHHTPVHVIDVEHQEELEGWTLEDLIEYFEDDERLALLEQKKIPDSPKRSRHRRKAAEASLTKQIRQRPRVLNQISLEFSKTPLSDRIASPQFVREIDWIDNAWPRPRNNDGTLSKPWDEIYPNVQYYCLTSAAGCYTDFHIDFGGTSVWYHILSGEKIFCLIPPTDANLKIYEGWLCSPDQASTFLPDLIPDPQHNVLRISLKESQTLIIPTAWIHAVYTPSDSIVIGGNFLHGMDIPLQVEVHCIEARTRVQEKFRFPFFIPLNFYAGGYYLEKLRDGTISQGEVDGLGSLIDSLEQWWKVHAQGSSQLQSGPTVTSAAKECAKKNHCENVPEFFQQLRSELQRVVQDGISPNPVLDKPNTPSDPAVPEPLETPSSPSKSKPKLRLTLSSKSSTPSKPPKEERRDEETKSKFRIVVSSSKRIPVAPRISKRPREDTEWMDDGLTVEDEWLPEKAPKPKRLTPSTSSNKVSAPPRRTSKPSTARQRLNKRLR